MLCGEFCVVLEFAYLLKYKSKSNYRDRKNDVCRAVAEIADAPTYEYLVNDIVQCVYHQ